MAFPPLVASGEIVSAAHTNAIRNALITWPGNVSAGGYELTALSVLSGEAGLLELEATLLSVGPDGTHDAINYGRGIQITRSATAAQQLAFIRAGNRAVSLGYLPSSNTFGLGEGAATDASFLPSYFCVTASGAVGIGETAPTAKLQIKIPSIANTVGAAGWLHRWQGNSPSGNVDQLLLQQVRASDSVTDWTGTQWRLGRSVDGVGMADLVWDNFDLCVFTAGSERVRFTAAGRLKYTGTPVYADNAAAVLGGLVAGTQYRTSTGQLMEVF